MSKTIKVARSSISGKFVSKKYAKNHPKTTEVETVKINTTNSSEKK